MTVKFACAFAAFCAIVHSNIVFIIGGGLQPILDLRHLNYALMKRSFRMITLKQILLQIFQGTGSCCWI